MRFNKHFRVILPLAVLLFVAAARVDVGVMVGAPPPPPPPGVIVGPVGIAPGPGYVWVPGHYMQPRRGYHWAPDHYVQRGPHYRYVPGHWVR